MAQTDLMVSLSEHDRQAWQMKLWELLRLQTERYTSGQSMSVRTDTAQMLLRSICFSLDQIQQAQPERNLLQEPLDILLREGAEVVRRQTARTQLQYRRACRCLYQEESVSLRDTLRGIAAFSMITTRSFSRRRCPATLTTSWPTPCRISCWAWRGSGTIWTGFCWKTRFSGVFHRIPFAGCWRLPTPTTRNCW